jgi:hypothetical protein
LRTQKKLGFAERFSSDQTKASKPGSPSSRRRSRKSGLRLLEKLGSAERFPLIKPERKWFLTFVLGV